MNSAKCARLLDVSSVEEDPSRHMRVGVALTQLGCAIAFAPERSHFATRRAVAKVSLQGLSLRETSATNSDAKVVLSTIPIQSLLDSGLGVDYAKVHEEETIANAVEIMNSKMKSAALVFSRSDKVVGIFTERDFITTLAQVSPLTDAIASIMTPADKLLIGDASWTIQTCQDAMTCNKVRHLPIMKKSELLGLISQTDIIRYVATNKALMCARPRFFGSSLSEVSEQSKIAANELALERGVGKQDAMRGAFIVTAALATAAILQASWVHSHAEISMIGVFVLGYVGIIFETFFEFNKAAVALVMCTALWTIFAGNPGATGVAIESSLALLSEKVSEVSEVVFFLLGAMTIVEIVDAHQGFKVVTDAISSKKKRSLMLVVAGLTFFMSAVLDNLTTTIVMVSLIKELLPDDQDRKLFGALIVIAANAGGAWTPIGDVTTTMLWINGQISAIPTMTNLFLPSIASVAVSTALLQQQIPSDELVPEAPYGPTQLAPRGQLVFAAGLGGLLSVPVFKALTGLPPYLGMLAALGLMWALTDSFHAGEKRDELMAPAALRKIDSAGVLFFLGILLSVGALDASGILRGLATFLDNSLPNEAAIATIIGLASAVIDNVPLVAATMGMYKISDVPMDSSLWQLIAFCAGTGGSLLIIGSAAGVALMGIEKVDFTWYARKVSASAALGYLAGIGVYLAQDALTHQTNAVVDLPEAVNSLLGFAL